MSCEDPENKSGCCFGIQNSNNSSSGAGMGLEISSSTSSSGFGVETPSNNPSSNYGGISKSEAEVNSFLNMLHMNHGNTKGIAGGEAYLGTITSSYDDDSIEDFCDEIEIDNGESWIERGSIFGSAIKIVTEFYNKYFSSEQESIGKVVRDIDKTIATAIEEVSSGGWDNSFRNIQLDGCIGTDVAESSDGTDLRFIGSNTNGITLNGSAGEILSASGDGVEKSSSD